jgi:hypothetical protein
MRWCVSWKWIGAAGALALVLSFEAPATAQQVTVGPGQGVRARAPRAGAARARNGVRRNYGVRRGYGRRGYRGPFVTPGTVVPQTYIPLFPNDYFGANLTTPVYGGLMVPGFGVVNNPGAAAPAAPGNGQFAPGVSGGRATSANNGQFAPGASGNRLR